MHSLLDPIAIAKISAQPCTPVISIRFIFEVVSGVRNPCSMYHTTRDHPVAPGAEPADLTPSELPLAKIQNERCEQLRSEDFETLAQ
jgi:hypothetical protein